MQLKVRGEWARTISSYLENFVKYYPVNQTTIDAFIKGFNEGIEALESKTIKSAKDIEYIEYGKRWLEILVRDLGPDEDYLSSSDEKLSDRDILDKENEANPVPVFSSRSFRNKEDNQDISNNKKYITTH